MIAQESLQAFINALSPGAYSSITKVNFKKLDGLLLKPIGVYGSRQEIVKFLREMGSVDVEMCVYRPVHRSKAYPECIGSGNCSFRNVTTHLREQNPS